MERPTIRPRQVLTVGGAMVLALGVATLAVAVLEHGFNLVDASSVYLLAVVVMAVFFGVGPGDRCGPRRLHHL